MTGIRQIETRWGVPFWDLVADFADQGLNRSDTARALGYRVDSFCSLLSRNPGKDPFDCYVIAQAYLKDTGETMRQALERMAIEGRSWAYAASAIGYSDGSRLKRAAESRGIHVVMNSRHGRPRTRPIPLCRGPNVSQGWPTWEQVYKLTRASPDATVTVTTTETE